MGVTLRERKLPSGNTQLYLDIHRYVAKGQYDRHTEALFILKKGQAFENREYRRMAEEIRSQRSLELDAQAFGVSATQKRTSSFIRYLEEQRDLRLGETLGVWRNAVERFRKHAGEQVTFAELTPTFLDKFKTYLLQELTPNSAKVYFSCIKSALNQAVRDGILAVNPAGNVRIKGSDTLPVYLTLEELKKLDETQCKYDQVKRAFFFSCFTGLRYSDVSALTWRNIQGDAITFQMKKTKREQVVPLSKEAVEILKGQKGVKPSPDIRRKVSEDLVFQLPSQPAVYMHIQRWAKDAGINKSISFHKARHSYAMMARSKGIPLHTIKGLLGHQSLEMTEKYARLDELEKRKAVKKFPTLR